MVELNMEKPIVAVVGLGKLGFPIAIAIGITHKVIGYDIDPSRLTRQRPLIEEGPRGDKIEDWVKKSDLTFTSSIQEAVRRADIIFVAIQTPHDPQYEGITPVPEERKD